jgi:Autophagy-related protein 27
MRARPRSVSPPGPVALPLSFLFILFLSTSPVFVSAEGPQYAYACEWDGGDGEKYDLRPLAKLAQEAKKDFTFRSGTNSFFLSPCMPSQSADCGDGVATCMQWDPNRPNGEASLGSVTAAKIAGKTLDVQKTAGGFTYEFTKGSPSLTNGIERSMNLEFVCDPNPKDPKDPGLPTFGGEGPALHFTLQWITPYACPVGGISAGSVILIVLLCVVFLYFVGGAVFMKFVRKAEGLEIVPHIEFWTSLPGLVKDGCLFIGSKTCCRNQYSAL